LRCCIQSTPPSIQFKAGRHCPSPPSPSPSRHSSGTDARLDPAKYAGLAEGDAHVIRNAGGRASDDAIRSLVISYKLLGTREWFVIHHTNCGMETFTDEVMRGLLVQSLKTSSVDASGWHDSGHGEGSRRDLAGA
jgi:hypothetical protein